MNIIATQYSAETKSIDIYLAGCRGNPHCTNCHNPQTWDFNQGSDWREWIPKIELKLGQFDSLIENVMILGGEPFDQDQVQLCLFLLELYQMREEHNVSLWLFTRLTLDELEVKPEDTAWKWSAIQCADFIKCGRYLPEESTEDNWQYGIKLASANQKIYRKGKDY